MQLLKHMGLWFDHLRSDNPRVEMRMGWKIPSNNAQAMTTFCPPDLKNPWICMPESWKGKGQCDQHACDTLGVLGPYRIGTMLSDQKLGLHQTTSQKMISSSEPETILAETVLRPIYMPCQIQVKLCTTSRPLILKALLIRQGWPKLRERKKRSLHKGLFTGGSSRISRVSKLSRVSRTGRIILLHCPHTRRPL